jgi:hypothetical protein
MPVPSVITDLSTTAGSNSPAGTDPIGTDADNYIRAHAAFIAQLRDGSKNLELGTATAPALAFTGDSNTGIYSPAANQVSIVTNGVQRLSITDTTQTAVGILVATGLIKGNNGGSGLGQITVSTSAPSGGSDGDLWLRYE